MLSVLTMDHIEITTSDRDHLWWLERTKVPLNLKVHVDLGCGAGALGRSLLQRGVETSVGVDVVDFPALKNSKPDRPDLEARFKFLNLDLNRSDWPASIHEAVGGAKVDLVTAFDFLEHVDSPWSTLRSIAQILDSGGRLVLTTPNVMSWERVLRPTCWSGAQDPQHKILLQPYSLRFLLERTGFELELLRSPLRKLGPIGWGLPIGGQMIAVARKV